MRVCVLIARPDRPMDFLQQPIEALYTTTVLAQRGHEATLVDLRVTDPPAGGADEPVEVPDPELFVLVTQTYDLTQCYSISLDNSARTVASLRRRFPGVPVVAAGLHASMRPEMTVREIGCDQALPGEIEVAVPWLVDRLAADPRIIGRPMLDGPRVVDPAELPVPDYRAIDVAPYWSEIVDPATETVSRGTTGLLFANRGCPYTCTYCFVWFGQKIRQRPTDLVVQEMAAQRVRGVRHFFFLDYTFTISKPWVRDLCQKLRRERLDVSWICQTRCERVDTELLAEMRSAGCVGIFYGVESPWISETNLDKPTPRPLIEATIRDTVAAKIHPLLFILFGTEDKDPGKGEELYAWLRDLPGTFLTSALLPRPFTTLWDELTRDLPVPRTWKEHARIAEHLRDDVFSSPTMRAVQDRIHALPNYVGNRPRVMAVAGRPGG